MITASHMVAGATVGAVCRKPWIAVPAAFASHFVLDQIPHSCFNALPEPARVGPARLATYAGQVLGGAVMIALAALIWRHPRRWLLAACAVAAFLPDPLCYKAPLNKWFAALPGSWVVPWVHGTFHIDVTRTHCALGFATLVVVIALGFWVLRARGMEAAGNRGE